MVVSPNPKIVLTYRFQGDVRRIVTYVTTADGVQGDGSLGPGLSDLVAKFALVLPHDAAIISVVQHNVDKSLKAAATGYPINAPTLSYNEATSILAYHLVFKDAAGKNCGHSIHNVSNIDTGVVDIAVGAPLSEIDGGGARWNDLVNSLIAHTMTVSGSQYSAFLHVRLLLKRDRATGGKGRKMSNKRAAAYLLKHSPTSLSVSGVAIA